MEPKPSSGGQSLLALRASRAREHLAATLAALDRREHEAVDVPLQVKRHSGALVVAGVFGSGIIAFAAYRIATAPRRRAEERGRMLRRVWTHPEWAARPRGPTVGTFARPIVSAAVGAVATHFVAKAMRGTGA